jgi:hypothetical protein
MAKQTFTTGQVLTAAQMTSLQQTAMLGGAASAKTASYTLVAADAGTAITMSNAGATTITVNTALFAAGDTVQITNLGVGVCTITAGTATVDTSASLALAQYESGTLNFTSTSAAIFIKGAGAAASSSGLTLLTNAAFTTVSSYSLPNSTFSSTYTNYKIILDITAFSASNTFIARLRSSGSDYSGNQYLNQTIDGSGGTASASDSATNTSISLGDPNSNVNYQLEMELFRPNVAGRTWAIPKFYFLDNGGSWHIRMQGNRIDTSTQYDSMSIIPSTGTMTGRIFVYGYAI